MLNFLFSERDMLTFSKKDVLEVVRKVHKEVANSTSGKTLSESFYVKIMEQCHPIGAVLSPTDEKEACLYFFMKSGKKLKYVELEMELPFARLEKDEFPVDLLFGKTYIIECDDSNELLEDFLKNRSHRFLEFQNYFNSLKSIKNGIFSIIGTTIGQTWMFYAEKGVISYLSPYTDEKSGKLFLEKKDLVPLTFLLEHTYIPFYQLSFSLSEDAFDLVRLNKDIFEMINKEGFFIGTREEQHTKIFESLQEKPQYFN